MPKLRSVPDTAPRAVIYLRQSVSRDDSISLELQETACRDYCSRRGYEVVAVKADPGISGRTWKRPGVQATMQMVESHEADVIVLWRWSRLSRSVRDYAVAIDRADVAGGRIESATEPVDVTTASGHLQRGMMTQLAEWDSRVKGEQWREAHLRRLKSGKPHGGVFKWGYRYEDGEYKPDPDTGHVLAQLYSRYNAGESAYTLVRWLNANGYRTRTGGLWRDSVLRRVLDSGFAAGRITYKDQEFDGVHERLIDAEVWAEYNRQRKLRSVVPARTKRSQYLLSGLVRCECGSSMTAGQYGANHQPKYRCANSKERGAHDGGGYVMARFVEKAVMDWLATIADEVDESAAHAAVAQAAKVRSQSQVKRTAREITRIDEQLTELTLQFTAKVVPLRSYETARDQLIAQRERLGLQLAREESQSQSGPPVQAARSLLEQWDLLPVELRRSALKALLARVIVRTGRPHAIIRVVPVWDE